MPLIALWSSNREAINEFSIEQVVTSAGDGLLKDGSNCSTEFREFLTQIPTSKIANYVDQCLQGNLARGGLVLQDLVNELGRRLDFRVENGRYQGVQNAIGFDGIWKSPEGQSIVVETKTTDAYRLSLNTLANYRVRLAQSDLIQDPSSILIIVGRQDTGELEAQIRGSRHAWDIRVISAEALVKMIELKEKSDNIQTGLKIRSLLVPVEYTRLDKMVDVMFTTAVDVEASAVLQEEEAAQSADREATIKSYQFTDGVLLQEKRERIIDAFARINETALVRKSRALYRNPDQSILAACSISKRYSRGSSLYWYAYHPQWDDFLQEANRSFFILGCMDIDYAFAIPHATIREKLELLNTTIKDGTAYWHIHLIDRPDGNLSLTLPKSSDTLSLAPYRFNF